MSKILVTGGAGFIGHEVVRQLLKRKHTVRILDNLSKPGSENNFNCEFIKVDLTNSIETERAFAGGDLCINLAAKIGGIGYFNKYPATILLENNKIYSSTFEAAVKNKLKKMVYVSSSMVYEKASKFPSAEKDLDNISPPTTSYGFSKLIGEKYCKSFWLQYGLPYSICRPFNAYGPNEAPENKVGYAHVIPDLVKKILIGQYPVEILGNGKQTRCFTHVSDIASGIVDIAESDKANNQDFNIANPDPISMLELAELIWKITGKKKPFKASFKKGFPDDVQTRIPDISKIKKTIGWSPKVKFEAGLRETIRAIKEKL